MHDFCFTIPYGLILVAGGVIGYSRKGSTASLAGGAGTGLVLILAGYLSLKAFEKKKNSYFALVLETGDFSIVCLLAIIHFNDDKCWLFFTDILYTFKPVTAAVLTWIMGQRYYQTSKVMPAGIVAGISALMTGFYLYKIATGGNHFPAKTE
ncbi:protein FATTY ACID EXPORT 6-like [Gossypium australe]|uniref:Protein FATTY ACID EXPORT 6-like n=2 Tax=Gossypium TaxID=3633 RepID=A0A5B6U7X2_9ROSI|nr:protein FATTY ACID EXPORT 6-like [Gossypium australe]